MLKFTVDTNTLVSAVISSGNEYQLLDLAREGRVMIVTSPDILKEFKEVISREKFCFSQQQVDSVVKQIVTICQVVIPLDRIQFVKEDPDDDRIIECAVTGKVDYIVSGDTHLLNLRQYERIPIIKTTEALRIIHMKN